MYGMRRVLWSCFYIIKGIDEIKSERITASVATVAADSLTIDPNLYPYEAQHKIYYSDGAAWNAGVSHSMAKWFRTSLNEYMQGVIWRSGLFFIGLLIIIISTFEEPNKYNANRCEHNLVRLHQHNVAQTALIRYWTQNWRCHFHRLSIQFVVVCSVARSFVLVTLSHDIFNTLSAHNNHCLIVERWKNREKKERHSPRHSNAHKIQRINEHVFAEWVCAEKRKL